MERQEYNYVVLVMKIFNKLIRDKIPSIIETSGKDFDIRTLSHEEYKLELKRKVIEEAKELFEANTTEEIINELGDVLEVVDSIIKEFNLDKEILNNKRIEKYNERGGFDDKLFLISVSEKK